MIKIWCEAFASHELDAFVRQEEALVLLTSQRFRL